MTRRKHSDKALDERLEEDTELDEPCGILEIFLSPRSAAHFVGAPEKMRDEDAPLARDPEDDDAS